MSVLYRMVVDDVVEYVVVNDVHFAILVYMDLTFAVAREGRRTRVSMTLTLKLHRSRDLTSRSWRQDLLLHVACEGWDVRVNDLTWYGLGHTIGVVQLGIDASRIDPELLERLL